MKNKCLHVSKISIALIGIAENDGEWNLGCFLGENGQIVGIYTIIFLGTRLNSQVRLISSVYTRFSKILSVWVRRFFIYGFVENLTLNLKKNFSPEVYKLVEILRKRWDQHSLWPSR